MTSLLVLYILWQREVLNSAVPHQGSSCCCGYQFTDTPGNTLKHMFWECPVAQSVVNLAQQQHQDHPLTIEHVWLLKTPDGQVDTGTWTVVAIALLNAMDYARSLLYRKRREWMAQHGGQQPEFGPESPIVMEVKDAAVCKFWSLLLCFSQQYGVYDIKHPIRPHATHPWICMLGDEIRVDVPEDVGLQEEDRLWPLD